MLCRHAQTVSVMAASSPVKSLALATCPVHQCQVYMRRMAGGWQAGHPGMLAYGGIMVPSTLLTGKQARGGAALRASPSLGIEHGPVPHAGPRCCLASKGAAQGVPGGGRHADLAGAMHRQGLPSPGQQGKFGDQLLRELVGPVHIVAAGDDAGQLVGSHVGLHHHLCSTSGSAISQARALCTKLRFWLQASAALRHIWDELSV